MARSCMDIRASGARYMEPRYSFIGSGYALPRVSKWAARAMRWLAWPITIYAICVAWIFFRAHDLNSAGTILKQFALFHGGGNEHFHRWFLLVIMRTYLDPLAQFSPMVCRIMATMACPSLRSGLRLHFCSRPFICSAPLHALHLFSVLSPKPGIKLHAQKDRRRVVCHPECNEGISRVTKDLPLPRKIGRFLASLGMITE